MYSNPTTDGRYRSPMLNNLLNRIGQQHQTQELNLKKKIEEQRKMCYSYSANMQKSRQSERRPLFNNKTKEGSLLDIQVKSIPYKFIPKYKNQTFIMPNRAFQKGKAGKRFYIKMKDTSIYSFRDEESIEEKTILKRFEKEKTILSRKVQEFNRVVDVNDGRIRASNNKEFLKTRKKFNYTDAKSELFSQSDPMLQPKDSQTRMVRKISLTKAFDFTNKWKFSTQGANFFKKNKLVKSAYSHYPQTSSVL